MVKLIKDINIKEMDNISLKKFLDIDKLDSIEISHFSGFKRTFTDVYKISIMRTLMNQLIEKIYFKGNVLDIGGGKNSNYKNLLNCDKYTSINIDKKIDPHILLKVNEKFPLNEKTFDTCLLFNVLEHIFDWEFIFNEITRILRTNGELHIIIPFSYPIHGSPNDYLRVTHDYLKIYLEKWNFKNIRISPISYGPFSNSQIIGYTHKLINGPYSQIAVVLDKIFYKIFKKKYNAYNKRCPLFYYVSCVLI